MKKTVIFKGRRFSNYEVDDKGNIFRKGSLVPLKPFFDGRGYHRVDLMSDDHMKVMAKLHLVVAHTFIGPQVQGMIINHKDGVKTNNRLKNLEYISQRENVAHAQRLIKNVAYLEDDTILAIHNMLEAGDGIKDISVKLNIPYYVVRDLVYGKTYTHVKP